MKADVKSEKFHRIRYLVLLPLLLPLRFVFGCIAVIWTLTLKPYPSAFKEFGIRVVDPKDNGTWDNHIKVYTALELLNRHDREKLELIKKHIRIIFLTSQDPHKVHYWKTGGGGAYYWGLGVCLLNIQKIPAEKCFGTIIGWLVYEASRVNFAGKLGVYLGPSEEVKNLCKEECRRTQKKFCE